MAHYMFNNSLVDLSKGKIDTKDLVKSVYFNINPATDDRPFFFDNQPGIPFPTGINLAKEMGLESSVPWLYGINGTMSVLGSVLALTVSTTLGFTASLILGTLCYLAIALIFKLGEQIN